MIAAPTPHVWIIGRTQTNGPADYEAVHEVQRGYRVTILGEQVEHVVDSNYDIAIEPLRMVNGMPPMDYFGYAADLLTVNPPHATDFSQRARLARLGIVAGEPFDPSRFSAEQKTDIEAGWSAAVKVLLRQYPPRANWSTAG